MVWKWRRTYLHAKNLSGCSAALPCRLAKILNQHHGLDDDEREMRNVEFEMKDWETHTNSTFHIPNSTLRR